MNPEQFNPHQEKYKKTADLPEDKREDFKDVEGGFVKKEVVENEVINSIAAKLEGIDEMDAMIDEAKDFDEKREMVFKLTEGVSMEYSRYRKVMATQDELKHILFNNRDLLADREVAIKVLEKFPKLYVHFPKEIKADKEIVLKALNSGRVGCGDIMEYVPENLKRDKEVVLAAIGKESFQGYVLTDDKVIRDEFCDDLDVISKLSGICPADYLLKWVGEKTKEKIESKKKGIKERRKTEEARDEIAA
jgi:hypothetical protein